MPRVQPDMLQELIDNEGALKSGPISEVGVWRLALDLKEARETLALVQSRCIHGKPLKSKCMPCALLAVNEGGRAVRQIEVT